LTKEGDSVVKAGEEFTTKRGTLAGAGRKGQCAVSAGYRNVNAWPLVLNLESGQMMDSRKGTVPSKSRQMRVGVAPRDEHADLASLVIVPLDGKPVGDIFGSQANRSG
jgi:hypothetical protein